MLLVRGKDVDLAGQRFEVTVIKGRRRMGVWKTIKDIAQPLGAELNPETGQYVFSEVFIPGETAINPKQVYRRWNKRVMEPLKIKVTFYKLKHLNTTKTVDLLSEKEAALLG